MVCIQYTLFFPPTNKSRSFPFKMAPAFLTTLHPATTSFRFPAGAGGWSRPHWAPLAAPTTLSPAATPAVPRRLLLPVPVAAGIWDLISGGAGGASLAVRRGMQLFRQVSNTRRNMEHRLTSFSTPFCLGYLCKVIPFCLGCICREMLLAHWRNSTRRSRWIHDRSNVRALTCCFRFRCACECRLSTIIAGYTWLQLTPCYRSLATGPLTILPTQVCKKLKIIQPMIVLINSLSKSIDPYIYILQESYLFKQRFEEGAEQFRIDVAANPNDTEESIWCFLCEAQLYGIEEARKRFLEASSIFLGCTKCNVLLIKF